MKLFCSAMPFALGAALALAGCTKSEPDTKTKNTVSTSVPGGSAAAFMKCTKDFDTCTKDCRDTQPDPTIQRSCLESCSTKMATCRRSAQ